MTSTNGHEAIGNPSRAAAGLLPIFPQIVEFSDSATALAIPAPSTARPVDDIVNGVQVLSMAGKAPVHVGMSFVLNGSAGQTATCKLIRWNRWRDQNGQNLWVPHQLLELSIVAGAVTGDSGHIVSASVLFADAITVVTDDTRGSSADVRGSSGIAEVTFDAMGSEFISVITAVGTATSIAPCITIL